MLVHSPRLSIASSFGDGPTSVPPACGIKSPRRVWRPVRNVWQNSGLPLSSDINTSSGLPAAVHGRHAWKARCGLTRRKTSGTTACCEEGWYEVHRAQRDAARSMVCDSHPFACKKRMEPQRHFPRDSAALAKASNVGGPASSCSVAPSPVHAQFSRSLCPATQSLVQRRLLRSDKRFCGAPAVS